MGKAQLIHFDDWLVVAAFVSVVVAVGATSIFWKWWENPLGRSMMAMESLVAAALLPGTLRRLFNIAITSNGFLWFLTIIIGLIIPSVAWRTIVLWRIQRRPLDAPSEERMAAECAIGDQGP